MKSETTKVPIQDIDWNSIGIRLTTYAENIAQWKIWAKGNGSILSRGYTPNDVANEVICNYLEEHGFEHSVIQKELFKKFKWEVWNKITGLSRLKENTHTNAKPAQPEDKVTILDPEWDIDTNALYEEICDMLEDEEELLEIFIWKWEDKSRSQIVEELDITKRQYDNRVKRLRRRIESIFQKYDICRS